MLISEGFVFGGIAAFSHISFAVVGPTLEKSLIKKLF